MQIRSQPYNTVCLPWAASTESECRSGQVTQGLEGSSDASVPSSSSQRSPRSGRQLTAHL